MPLDLNYIKYLISISSCDFNCFFIVCEIARSANSVKQRFHKNKKKSATNNWRWKSITLYNQDLTSIYSFSCNIYALNQQVSWDFVTSNATDVSMTITALLMPITIGEYTSQCESRSNWVYIPVFTKPHHDPHDELIRANCRSPWAHDEVDWDVLCYVYILYI